MPLKTGPFYQFGPFRLDAEQRLLWNGDQLVPLAPKALETLLALVENQGRLVGKDELIKRLWPNTFVEENNLTFNVSVLRKALGDGQSGFIYIETIPRRGYRFVAPVVETGCGVPNPGTGEGTATPSPGTSIVLASGSNGAALQEAGTGRGPVLGRDGEASAEEVPQKRPQQASTLQPESRRASPEARRRARLAVAAAIGAIAAVTGYVLVRPLPPLIVHNTQVITNDGLEKGYLATDGWRLYFTERARTGELVLKQISTRGGEPSVMSPPVGDPEFLDLSADQSSLLLSRAGGAGAPIWLLPLPGGSPRRLGDLQGREASWSPDGRRIAYSSGHEIWVANQDGGASRTIAAVEGEVRWPRWSPDGTQLSFTISSSTASRTTDSLWEVPSSGAGARPLLPGWNDPPMESHGSWTPDGKYFVFESNKAGKEDIWAIRERVGVFDRRGHEPVKLTDLPQWCYNPLLSPDGKRVFFVGRTARGRLERFSPVEKQFVTFLDGVSAEWAAYSPDGGWVAYVKYPDGTLWRMRQNGTELRQLTFLPMKVQGLAWSPDGRQIAFNAWAATNRYKNYLVAVKDGEEPKELRPGHPEMEGIPSWSEDGKKIAFGDVPEVFGRATRRNVIHILDLLTGKVEGLPHSEGFWTARWSPGGRYIAALEDDDPDPTRQPLFVYDRKTGRWQDLHVDHVRILVWSHDGKYIYYDGEPNHEGIFRVRVPNGRPELVANTNRILRTGTGWFGLTQEDSPVILRDAGSEEIYSVDVDWH